MHSIFHETKSGMGKRRGGGGGEKEIREIKYVVRVKQSKDYRADKRINRGDDGNGRVKENDKVNRRWLYLRDKY